MTSCWNSGGTSHSLTHRRQYRVVSCRKRSHSAGERLLDWSAPRQHEVPALGQREGLAGQVGHRDVGRQAELGRKSLVAHVVGAMHPGRHALGPPETRVALHPDPRRTGHRLHDAHELRRPERTVVLNEAGREIEDAHGAARRVEGRLEDVRVLEVALRAALAPAGPTRKRPPPFASSSVENTGSESKRGRQHQTTSPVRSMSAENWQLPIRPRSSSRIHAQLSRLYFVFQLNRD